MPPNAFSISTIASTHFRLMGILINPTPDERQQAVRIIGHAYSYRPTEWIDTVTPFVITPHHHTSHLIEQFHRLPQSRPTCLCVLELVTVTHFTTSDGYQLLTIREGTAVHLTRNGISDTDPRTRIRQHLFRQLKPTIWPAGLRHSVAAQAAASPLPRRLVPTLQTLARHSSILTQIAQRHPRVDPALQLSLTLTSPHPCPPRHWHAETVLTLIPHAALPPEEVRRPDGLPGRQTRTKQSTVCV